MMSDVVILTRSQKFFYCVAKVVGLAPFTIKDNKLYPATFLSKAYNVILTVFIILTTFMQLYYKFNSIDQLTPAQFYIHLLANLIPCASSVSCLLIFSFRSKVIVEIIERIYVVRDQLRRLKNAMKDENIFKNCTVKVVARIVVIMGIRIVSEKLVNLDSHSLGFIRLGNFGTLIFHSQHFNASLIFVQIIHCINQGFGHLNNELKNLFRSDCDTFVCDEPHYIPSATRTDNNRIVADRASRERTIRYSVKHIAKIRVLHRELRELLEYTAEFFTIPLFWTLGYQFSRLLFISFGTYKYVFSSLDVITNTGSSYLTLLFLIARLTDTVLEIYFVIDVCTTAYKVGNTMKVILHQVWNKCRAVKLRDEFFMFSIQLLRNPVVVSVYGIFDLDHSYLYKMTCTMLAYLIIMIQLKNL